jgi:twitching motility protein PilT
MEASIVQFDHRQILEAIDSRIPDYVRGDELQKIIYEAVQSMNSKTRLFLKEHFKSVLLSMIEQTASDIDMGGNGCKGYFWFRVFGTKDAQKNLGFYPLRHSDILIQNILGPDDIRTLFEKRAVDCSYRIMVGKKEYRFRTAVYFEMDHLCLNMRLINTDIIPIDKLGFHPSVVKILSLNYVKQGLILVTGITGSGKSTTLDSIIDANNRTSHGHVVIIANPIEFVHKPDKCIIRHREVGRDVDSFKAGAVQALRQDPDIIIIGEMRESETISTVLEAADSGHKAFTTLHTSSTTESIDRILGETRPEEQNRVRERLADVLTCVISQKLVPSLDGKRVMAKEVLVGTPAVRSAIRNNHTNEIYQLIYQGGEHGMLTIEQDLVRLYKSKLISYKEAYSNANLKKRFEELAKFSGVGSV